MAFKQLLTLAAVLIAQAGDAQSNSILRHQLEDRYADLMTALESKDEAAVRSLLAEGFVGVDVSGESPNVAQMMKGLLAFPNDANRQWKVTILSVRGDERAAVVKQRYDMTTKLKDTDGSEKPAAVLTLSTDNWVNENGSWRLARTVMHQLDATVDGKTVVHKTNSTTK